MRDTPRIVFAALVAALCLAAFLPADARAAPGFKNVVMSDAKDGPKDTHTFKPSTAKIFVRAATVDIPAGAVIRSEWIAVKTKVAPPNYKIDAYDLKATPGMNRIDLAMSKPNAGWPEGDYRVDILVDGKKVTDVRFNVVK